MRTKYLWFFIAVFIANSKCQSQSKSTDEQVVTMLKAFYTSYITVISESRDSIEFKLDSIKQKYCTADLLEKIENGEWEYDPLISAQDADIKWLKTLMIIKDQTAIDTYFVSFVSNYDQRKITIRLRVVLQNDRYKIDYIF
jgi:hypothetical protein